MTPRILIVDDEESIRFTFDAFLSDEGYRVHVAASRQEATALLEDQRFDAIFLDILLGRESGMEILQVSRKLNPNCPVIMVTGAPEVSTAAEAVRLGAFDYITKPVHQDELLRLAKIAVDHKRALDLQETCQQRMTAVYQSIPEGILIFDREFRLVDVNQAAFRLLACDGGLIGLGLEDTRLVECCQAIGQLRDLIKARCEGEIFQLNTTNGRGEPLALDVTMAPLTNQALEENGVVLVLRDVSRPVRQVTLAEQEG